MRISTFALALALVAPTGCTQDTPSSGAAAPTPDPRPATPPIGEQASPPAAPPAAPSAGAVSGKVLETMDAAGYTYVQIDAGPEGKLWAAGPTTAVAVGDTVGFAGGMTMRDFVSKSLGRTFETIYFVNAFQVGGAGAAAQPASQPSNAPASQPSNAPAVQVGKVDKADGGLTVAEVFAQAATLSGKPVTLRGKVVKYNANIMGKNWLHVQDGSGGAGTNDLTVTTDATAEVGDVVLVKGIVATDKDFGAGYRYPVLVEQATLTK